MRKSSLYKVFVNTFYTLQKIRTFLANCENIRKFCRHCCSLHEIFRTDVIIIFLDAGPAQEGGYVDTSFADGNILLTTQTNKQTPEGKPTYSY